MKSKGGFLRRLEKIPRIEAIQIGLLVFLDFVITTLSLAYYRITSVLDPLMTETAIIFIQVFSAVLIFAFVFHIGFLFLTGGWRHWVFGHRHTGGMKAVFWYFFVVELLVVFTSLFIGFGPESDMTGLILPEGPNAALWGFFVPPMVAQGAVPLRRLVLYMVLSLPLPYIFVKAAEKDKHAVVGTEIDDILDRSDKAKTGGD